MKTFIVLVKENYIRDAQIYAGSHFNDPNDDIAWRDFFPNHYVGIFKGIDEQDVVLEASEMTGLSLEMLETVELI